MPSASHTQLSPADRSWKLSNPLASLPLSPSSRHFTHHLSLPPETHADVSISSNKLNLCLRLRRGRRLPSTQVLHRETFGAGHLVASYTLISSIHYLSSIMAPKKRSQTPRHSGVAESSESILSQQQTPTTLLSDPRPEDRQRRQRDSPRPLSSARSPTQDTVASSRSPVVSDSPHSPVEGFPQGSASRRESSSTMRTSSISLDSAAMCTPTGRISKAKKGKRVHACEFPGCGKVSSPKGIMTPKTPGPNGWTRPQRRTPG